MQLKWIRYCAVFLALGNSFLAQELLSPDDAIRISLEKNFDVLISKNLKKTAGLQNNFGAAGMSPTISLNASTNASNLNSSQVFNTGVVQDKTGAKANGLNASLNADWLVFDGLRMFAVKKRLGLTEDLTSIQLKQQMENAVYDVLAAYYDVVRLNELIKAAKQNLMIYEERRKIAQLRLQIGSDSKVELLLSRSDENKAQSNIIQLEMQVLQSKAKLNTLMARAVDLDFNVADTITVNFNPSLDELKKSVRNSKPSLMIARQNQLIAEQGIKEAKGSVFPFITLNGSYLYTRTTSQAGFLFSNRQNGLNYGATLRWNLFNGGRTNNLIEERNVLFQNQQYITEQMQLQVDALVYLSYQSFLLNKKIVDLELVNLADSREVQSISLERYRIGKANLLETIETQRNLEEAQVRFINALYTIKMAEADLLRSNGSLVK